MCLAAALSLGGTAAAQPALNLELVASGFASPVGIANAHDGSNRLFVVEQGGTIKIYDGTQVPATAGQTYQRSGTYTAVGARRRTIEQYC
jgi:hypothetical protein